MAIERCSFSLELVFLKLISKIYVSDIAREIVHIWMAEYLNGD